MGDYESNPLLKLTGLWLEDGVPQNKAGLRMVKVEGKKWPVELQAGGCCLGKLWENEKGKATHGGSFLGVKAMVFKNVDKKFPDGPDFDVLVAKQEKKPQANDNGGFAGGGPSGDGNGGGAPSNDNGNPGGW